MILLNFFVSHADKFRSLHDKEIYNSTYLMIYRILQLLMDCKIRALSQDLWLSKNNVQNGCDISTMKQSSILIKILWCCITLYTYIRLWRYIAYNRNIIKKTGRNHYYILCGGVCVYTYKQCISAIVIIFV